MERRIGVVRKFFHDRGFGFLQRSPRRRESLRALIIRCPDVFLHVKQLKLAGIDCNKIETGDTLEFDITQYAKGLVASNVSLVR